MNSMSSNSFLFQRCNSISPLNYYLPFKKHYLVYRTLVHENYANVKTKYVPSKMAFLGNKREIKNYVEKLLELYSGHKIEYTNKHIGFYRGIYEKKPYFGRHNIFYFDSYQNIKINSIYDLAVSEIEQIDITDPNSSIRSFILLPNANEFNYFINGVLTKSYVYRKQKVNIYDIYALEIQKTTDSETGIEIQFAILHIDIYEMLKKAIDLSVKSIEIAKKISDKILKVYEDNKEKINVKLKVAIRNKKLDVNPVLSDQFKLSLSFNIAELMYNREESMIGLGLTGSLDVKSGEQTHTIHANANFVLVSKGKKGKLAYYIYTNDTTSAPQSVYRHRKLDYIEMAKAWGVIDIVLDDPFDNLLIFEHEIFQDKLVLDKIFS